MDRRGGARPAAATRVGTLGAGRAGTAVRARRGSPDLSHAGHHCDTGDGPRDPRDALDEHPLFLDGWNVFDFSVVALSLLPAAGPFATVARLARVLRVARAVSSMPELRLIIGTMLRSIRSMGHVVMMLGVPHVHLRRARGFTCSPRWIRSVGRDARARARDPVHHPHARGLGRGLREERRGDTVGLGLLRELHRRRGVRGDQLVHRRRDQISRRRARKRRPPATVPRMRCRRSSGCAHRSTASRRSCAG